MTVSEDVPTLQLRFVGSPPGPLVVRRAAPGDWASSGFGIVSGDELVGLNGTALTTMKLHNVQTMLKRRPLWLHFRFGGALVKEDVESLGLRLDGAPPGSVTVWSVEPGGWAESHGVKPGDHLRALGGQPVDRLLGRGALEKALRARPQRISFGPPAMAASPTRPSGWAAPSVLSPSSAPVLAAPVEVDALRLRVKEGQPLGFESNAYEEAGDRMLVRMVFPDSPAARHGLRIGAELLAVNRRPLAYYDPSALAEALEERPLLLKFSCRGTAAAGARGSLLAARLPPPPRSRGSFL